MTPPILGSGVFDGIENLRISIPVEVVEAEQRWLFSSPKLEEEPDRRWGIILFPLYSTKLYNSEKSVPKLVGYASLFWLPSDYKLIASEGQTPAHAPHSMHLSASIT